MTGAAQVRRVRHPSVRCHPSIDVASLFRDHKRLVGTNPANWTTKPIG
jgi:hypothetical protein